MSSVRPTRLIAAIFSALAISVFINTSAFAQEAPVSGTSVDSAWESTAPDATTAPPIDEDVATGDKVLELPQVTCPKDSSPGSCDPNAVDGDDDDSQAISAPSPGAPPTVDDDTADSAVPGDDFGNVNDYQNQEVNDVPYPVYPSTTTALATVNSPSVPSSTLAPMSSPITQAARPSLNPGPWMLNNSMSVYSRPAGGPMLMASPAWGLHR
jgi:hypothetical protein